MKRKFILALGVIFLCGLVWTAHQEIAVKIPDKGVQIKATISSVSQKNLPNDIEIIVDGAFFPITSSGYQVKFGEHLLAHGSVWTQTKVSGILPHNILGAEIYPVSVVNSKTGLPISYTAQYFLMYNLTGYTPKFGVFPGTRIHISTPLGFDKAEVSKFIKFDDTSVWPGFTFSYSNWTIDFDIPKNVAVPSSHEVYLYESGKQISNTININVTGRGYQKSWE